MKNFIKRMMGLDKIEASILKAEQDLEDANRRLAESEKASEVAKEEEESSKLTPKDRATRKKEPWVCVLNTHVNKENIRNGFFELDWNDYFVIKLKQEGYGFDGDNDEEIVDRWFRELCANIVVDGDFGGPVNTGVLDVANIKKNNK